MGTPNTHSFREDIAMRYGVDEAIYLQHLYWWTTKNEANKRHEHEGRHWSFNSHRALSILFPFWTPRQVQRIIASCVQQKAVIAGNFNEVGYDRTLWYTLTDESLALFTRSPIQPNSENHLTERLNASNGIVEPIPVNNTVVKKENIVFQKIVARYNRAAVDGGLPTCLRISRQLKSHIGARLRDYPRPADWQPVFDVVTRMGKLPANERSWFTLAWIVKSPENFEKTRADWMAWRYTKTKERPANWADPSARDGLTRSVQRETV